MGDVPARIDEIDRDAALYVICHAGGRPSASRSTWPATVSSRSIDRRHAVLGAGRRPVVGGSRLVA
jgi:hypothetical protein